MIRMRRRVDPLSIIVALRRWSNDSKHSLKRKFHAVVDGVAEIDVATNYPWKKIETLVFEAPRLRLLVRQHNIVGTQTHCSFAMGRNIRTASHLNLQPVCQREPITTVQTAGQDICLADEFRYESRPGP